MSSSGKKTRDLPNLTECHCCHLRVDLARSKNKLQLLYSEWRIVLLCHKCLARVESAELCSYCFTSSSSGGDCFSCRHCKRRVHRDCDSNYRSAAVGSGSSSGEEISVCGDCWVSESLVRWRRSRNSKGCVRSKAAAESELGFERSRVSDPSENRKCGPHRSLDSCSEEGGGCSVRLDDVVEEEVEEEEENVDVNEDEDEDEDEPFKEGQGSCSNGGGVELEACSSPPEDCNCMTRSQFETCNGSSLDPYYFKYTRRKRSGDQCWLTYKRRRINIESCKSLSDVEELPLLTYKRRGRRFMFTYERRRIFGQSMLTYKRRKQGILYAKIQLQGHC